jgi:hypothetical protein
MNRYGRSDRSACRREAADRDGARSRPLDGNQVSDGVVPENCGVAGGIGHLNQAPQLVIHVGNRITLTA